MTAKPYEELIVENPDIMGGKPTVSGTRITVELILEILGSNLTREQIIENYPHITNEDINACLMYAADTVHDDWVLRKEDKNE